MTFMQVFVWVVVYVFQTTVTLTIGVFLMQFLSRFP